MLTLASDGAATMYLITDNYGTRQRAWTRRTALEWLAAAAPEAKITSLWGRTLAERTQVRVY